MKHSNEKSTEGVFIAGACQSSIGNWVKNNYYKNILCFKGRTRAAIVNRNSARARREAFRENGRKAAREGDLNHLKFCMLYWAEGTKSKNSFRFCNSDPEMINVCMFFLIEVMKINPIKVKFRLYFYDDFSKKEEIIDFWKIKIKSFAPEASEYSHVVNRYKEGEISQRKNKRNNMGVCHITVNDTSLVQHIYGALEVYAQTIIDPDK